MESQEPLGTPKGFASRVNHWMRSFGVTPKTLADESLLPYGRVVELISNGSTTSTPEELEQLTRALWGFAEDFLHDTLQEFDSPPQVQSEFTPFKSNPPAPRTLTLVQRGERKHSRARMDLSGQQFGLWKVLNRASSTHYHCRCECGTERNVAQQNLRSGASRSCGARACARKRVKGDTSNGLAA
jgi:hypothetical protein